MSKFFKFSLLLFTLFLIGCSSTPPQVSYISKIKIKPAVKKDQYYMDLNVTRMSYDEGEVIFKSPKMLIKKDVPVEILSGEIVKLKCNVIVSDNLGITEAKTDVHIDNMQTFETWNFSQNLLLDKKIEKALSIQNMKDNAAIKKIETKAIRKNIVEKESSKPKVKTKQITK
jgi:hypothetical protein